MYESFVPCHGRANQEQKKKRRVRRKASHGVKNSKDPRVPSDDRGTVEPVIGDPIELRRSGSPVPRHGSRPGVTPPGYASWAAGPGTRW